MESAALCGKEEDLRLSQQIHSAETFSFDKGLRQAMRVISQHPLVCLNVQIKYLTFLGPNPPPSESLGSLPYPHVILLFWVVPSSPWGRKETK